MALEGKTPADLAGIKVEGQNKWLTLIENASKSIMPETKKSSSEGATDQLVKR